VQRAADEASRASRRRLVIRDTDLVSTTVYARHYYGACADWIASAAREELGDLYLLLCPDVPWIPDGLQRDRPDEKARADMHAWFRDELAACGARVVEIHGSWDARARQASTAVAAAVADIRQTATCRSPSSAPARRSSRRGRRTRP
jgi:nicotinamide riboside kinase